MKDHHQLTMLGRVNWRGDRRLFGIGRRERFSHLYAIGKTGTGKSTLLESLALQDIRNGEGLALLDPHGDLVERLLRRMPRERQRDLIYFNVPDASRALAFNPLAGIPAEARSLAASNLVEVFKKLWADSWGPRLEHILRNTLLALLEQPEPTLGDAPRLLADKTYRKRAVGRVSNAAVREFWLKEFEGYPARLRGEAIAPVQNKLGAFLSNPLLRAILTQRHSAFELRSVMDERRLLLVNLSKGRIGEDTAALLGSLLVARLGLAALERAEEHPSLRTPFFLYLDEFPTFTTRSLGNMLAELRKYRVGLVLAHQYLGQLDDEVREAILGNVATMVSFRLGAEDAAVFERELGGGVREEDLTLLPNRSFYARGLSSARAGALLSGETVRM